VISYSLVVQFSKIKFSLAPFNVSAATLILYHVRLFNVKLFFNFFFELGMCISWPDLEYIMYRD